MLTIHFLTKEARSGLVALGGAIADWVLRDIE